MPARWPGLFLIGASFIYQESYKSSKKQQICKPMGTGGALSCLDIAVGEPTKIMKHLFRFEVRGYVIDGQLAINPRVTWDIKNDVTGFDLPFYFLKNGKGTLNGGVSIG